MFDGLLSALARWFGSHHTDRHQSAPSLAAKENGLPFIDVSEPSIPGEQDAFHVPYDETHLERARTQWQFGDWKSLAAIERDQLQHHPDRGKLALLAAAGLLQAGDSNKARSYIRLAQDWGINNKMISRILIAGVHNSLGRAAIANAQEQRALGHFSASVETGAPGGDKDLLLKARSSEQFSQLGVPQVLQHRKTSLTKYSIVSSLEALFPSTGDSYLLALTIAEASENRNDTETAEKYYAFAAKYASYNFPKNLLEPMRNVFRKNGKYPVGKVYYSTTEARIYISGGKVFKEYNGTYFEFNRQYKRLGEAYYLENFKSDLFIPVIEITPLYIVLPFSGCRIGEKDGGDNGMFKINFDKFSALSFIKWLANLKSELNKLELCHRDINPENILFNSETEKFYLIDFSWAIEASQSSNPRTKSPSLNPFAINDDEAIKKLMKFSIEHLIGQIGSLGYRPGSSVNKGWLYHSLPFKEFEKFPVHKQKNNNEFDLILEATFGLLDHTKSVIEIGSNVGGMAFRLFESGASITAVEADPFNYEVAEAIRIYKNISNIEFKNCNVENYLAENSAINFDLCIFMNVHMCMHKELGEEKLNEFMEDLANRVGKLIFQTSHKESGGMYVVEFLDDKSAIEKYLKSFGFKNIQSLSKTESHGGFRYMFICDGKNYRNSIQI